MVETLFIRLASNSEQPIHWLIYHADNHEIIASGQLDNAGQLAVLAEKAQNRQVIALASGSDVVLKAVNVPAKSNRAMRAATPYMLEDDLADDVEDLFFAYSDRPKGYLGEENCFVAIVSHKQMQLWQQWLGAANIECRILIPDFLCLPVQGHAWSLVNLEQQLIIRQNSWLGVNLDLNWGQDYFTQYDQAKASAESDEESKAKVPVHYYSPIDNLAIEQFSCFEFTHQPEELPLALMAKGALASSFNLLQGPYQVKKKRSPILKRYLLVASVALLALVMHLTHKGLELVQLSNQYVGLTEQIVKDYQQAFPQSRKVQVNLVRTLVNQKLKALSGGNNSADFLAMLERLTPRKFGLMLLPEVISNLSNLSNNLNKPALLSPQVRKIIRVMKLLARSLLGSKHEKRKAMVCFSSRTRAEISYRDGRYGRYIYVLLCDLAAFASGSRAGESKSRQASRVINLGSAKNGAAQVV
jgi:general secretion pathway protein L